MEGTDFFHAGANSGQNALSQSDSRIFKSTISPEQMDEIASFFAC